MKFSKITLLLCILSVLPACTPQNQQNYPGRMTAIESVDPSERIKLNTDLSGYDIKDIGARVTNKMLQDPIFADAPKPPRILPPQIINRTHDENLKVRDFYEKIESILLSSGRVRFLDKNATDYDYTMVFEISSDVKWAPDGQKLAEYRVKIKLKTMLTGELVGSWYDDGTSYLKGR